MTSFAFWTIVLSAVTSIALCITVAVIASRVHSEGREFERDERKPTDGLVRHMEEAEPGLVALPDVTRPDTEAVAYHESGEWHRFIPWGAKKPFDLVHAIKFKDGSLWDAVNGWRNIEGVDWRDKDRRAKE